ncbi:hypothetical protein [Halegenticoccus soli]|uniref:hypothetical protein n=1 Tax=Halegenticoccus soli TaxID=1985678 RepID=UPI000C6ECC6F|nr:hypothetical protein [Halegenticoccus soli]
MTLADQLDLETYERTGVRLMQLVLVGIVGYAAVTLNAGLLFNSAVPLAITFVPALLRRDYGLPMDAGLTLWITAAVFLHAVGALGPYRSIPWYDQVAHALSASVVAVSGYAVIRALEIHSDDVRLRSKVRAIYLIVFVLAFGVLWEIAEFASGGLAALIGGRALLAQYGLDDIVLDLLFNVAGAVIVAAWGGGVSDALSRAISRRVLDE